MTSPDLTAAPVLSGVELDAIDSRVRIEQQATTGGGDQRRRVYRLALIRAGFAAGLAAGQAVPRDTERWINLCRGYRKMVNAVAPHFDKPLTDENVVLWMNLNNAGATLDKALAMYDAATRGAEGEKP
jgi:hypothetical protein